MPMKNLRNVALFVVAVAPISVFGQVAHEFRDRPEIPKEWPREAVRGAHGMVATDERLASEAGVAILKRGGNAVDAAVATAFALAVVEPAAGNIGGGGFMLVRMADGKTNFFDYRETAPGKATREMYIKPDGKLDNEAATIGYKSVAVPGTVAGLALALRTHGTMKLAEVMAPAIRYAEDGIPVTEKLVREFAEERKDLQRFSMSSHVFLNDGKFYHVGDMLRQPELAATLNRAGPFGSGNPEPVIALPAHQLVYADEVGQAHLRLRFKSGDGAIVNGIAFRAIGQKLGNALVANRGQPLHVAGSLAVDRWQGSERVQLRVLDIATPDQGPAIIR